MPTHIEVFISSKMQELQAERQVLYELLPKTRVGDIQPHAWVFEDDAPAADKSIRDVYLEALHNSALYIGLFWNEYGEWTMDEFEQATAAGIERHIYIKKPTPEKQDKRLKDFLEKQGLVTTGVTARWFTTTEELQHGVTQSFEAWVQRRFLSHPGSSSAVLIKSPADILDQPTKLVGRDRALLTIEDLVQKKMRVLLQGLGGVGKTALAAVFVARWIRAGKGPALWLRVGSNSAEQVYQALAYPFGQQESMALAVHQSREREQIQNLLTNSGATLLVFDDVWWNRHALSEVLAALPSGTPVLATSRQRFSGMGAIFDVSDLEISDALELLSFQANRDCSQDGHASEVCERLSGHPYSIELAGKLLERRNWSTSTLLEKMKGAPHNLTIPDYSPKERSSVANMLYTTLEALDRKELSLFLACGHFFAPAVTAEMLQLHVGETQQVGPSLDQLDDWGLLRYVRETSTHAAHYRLHDLSFSYSRAKADEVKHTAALETLVSYSQAHKTPAPSDVAAVLPVLENFMGAVKYSMAIQRYRDVEDIVWNLHTKQQLSQFHGFYSESITLLEEAVQAARNVGNAEHEGAYIGNIGKLYSLTGRFEKAYDCQKQALEIAIRAGDVAGIAIDTSNLGLVCSQLGRHDEAIEYGRRGLSRIRETNDVRHECILLRYLGLSYQGAGREDEALQCFLNAQTISHQTKDRHQEHYILRCLGDLAFRREAFREAIAHFTASLSIAQELNNSTIRAANLMSIGCAHINLGENEQSLAFLTGAANAMREMRDEFGEAEAFYNLGIAYANLQRYQEAADSYGKALTLGEKTGNLSFVLNVRDAQEYAAWKASRQ